ncbi:MAG: glycosyltransferase family 4 protein [Acidobacteriota bacterium]
MKRPRIALVAASTEILGGQAVQAAALVDALRGDGWDVTFLPVNVPFPRGLGWLRRIRYARTIVNEALYLASLRALRDHDVVHVFTASYWSFLLVVPPVLVAARLLGLRTVVNYHSGEADDHLARHGVLVHPWLAMADELVVPSRYLRGVFARYGHDAKVVPNIVDLARFPYRERAALRPRLLSNRNLEPYYRVDDAIRAHALVAHRHGDARLVVAGDGSEAARLHALADELAPGSVEFVGRVEPADMPALYDACDVELNASVVDNQPLSILEAFAAGVPVVSTPTGDLVSMVRTGETGVSVPPRDPAAMAGAVEWLLAHPDDARRLARRAHAEVEQHRWSSVRGEWQAVYAGGAP